jgi:hypothetical protein
MTPEEAVRHIGSAKVRREELMHKIVFTVEDNIKREAPVYRGDLRRAITSRIEAAGARGLVGGKKSYLVYVHEGTKAHIIRPKSKKALFWRGGRHPVREVNHPGTRANRFMMRGLELSQESINELLVEEGVQLMTSMGFS